MNEDIETEPFSIANPSRKFYKFLFRVALDDETSQIAGKFINEWIEEKKWTIKRQKIVNLELQKMFQVKVWLN